MQLLIFQNINSNHLTLQHSKEDGVTSSVKMTVLLKIKPTGLLHMEFFEYI